LTSPKVTHIRTFANPTPSAQNASNTRMSAPAEESGSLKAFAPALFLLTLAFLINYVDRGNLSIAAPLLKRELAISPTEVGFLLSAFFWSYTAMQFIMGWLVDRFDANRILAAGFLLWSLATATTGLVRGFVFLFAMRLILGIGESVALPAGSKILAWHLPEHHRGFAGGLLMSGLRFGNAIGTLGAGLLMVKYGWRPVFIGIGLISLLWLPAWAKWMPRSHKAAPHLKSTEPAQTSPGFFDILAQRSFWGTTLGHFSCNYLFYFMITWLPSYLVEERHLTMATMTRIAGLYYSVDAFSAILGGWLQDFYIRKHYSPTRVRKTAMVIAFSLGAFGVAGCALADTGSYLPWLLAAGVGCGLSSPGIYAFCQRLAGPQAVGRWYGPQNGFANFAGVIGPALSGFLVQRTGNYLMPFAITSAVCVLGVIAWLVIVGRVEPVTWRPKAGPAISAARAEA
jgi:ACS family D-galactonate transporter-like MFS transporter